MPFLRVLHVYYSFNYLAAEEEDYFGDMKQITEGLVNPLVIRLPALLFAPTSLARRPPAPT